MAQLGVLPKEESRDASTTEIEPMLIPTRSVFEASMQGTPLEVADDDTMTMLTHSEDGLCCRKRYFGEAPRPKPHDKLSLKTMHSIVMKSYSYKID